MEVCATPSDAPGAVHAGAGVEVAAPAGMQEGEEEEGGVDADADGALSNMQLRLRPNLPLQRTYVKRADLGRAPVAASPLPPPASGVQAPVAATLPSRGPAAWW